MLVMLGLFNLDNRSWQWFSGLWVVINPCGLMFTLSLFIKTWFYNLFTSMMIAWYLLITQDSSLTWRLENRPWLTGHDWRAFEQGAKPLFVPHWGRLQWAPLWLIAPLEAHVQDRRLRTKLARSGKDSGLFSSRMLGWICLFICCLLFCL